MFSFAIDSLGNFLANLPAYLSSALYYFLIFLMILSTFGIFWAIYKRAEEERYSTPKMLESIFFNFILLLFSAYLLFFYHGSIVTFIDNLFFTNQAQGIT